MQEGVATLGCQGVEEQCSVEGWMADIASGCSQSVQGVWSALCGAGAEGQEADDRNDGGSPDAVECPQDAVGLLDDGYGGGDGDDCAEDGYGDVGYAYAAFGGLEGFGVDAEEGPVGAVDDFVDALRMLVPGGL